VNVEQTAEAILVAHQRHTSSSCLCGYSDLGRSHARHQVTMLRNAGLLKAEEEHDGDLTPNR
jgi:hypothetical protein